MCVCVCVCVGVCVGGCVGVSVCGGGCVGGGRKRVQASVRDDSYEVIILSWHFVCVHFCHFSKWPSENISGM